MFYSKHSNFKFKVDFVKNNACTDQQFPDLKLP